MKWEKSQNCVKAAIAFVCTTCKRQLLFALLQLVTFVCTTAIDNILSTTPIVNFCMPYYNCQRFYGTTTFVWTIVTITINITLLQLSTSKCTIVIDNFLSSFAIDYFCMNYCSWQLLFGILQLRTFACCRPALKTSATLIATMHIYSEQHYSFIRLL